MEKSAKKYIVYRITSPEGKSYIGATSTTIKTRWGQHQRRAFSHSHLPFYQAILKYDRSEFTVEVLHSNLTKEEASDLEIKHIAECGVLNRYNILSGGLNGESQGEAARRFWAKMDEDKEARDKYIQKLCDAQQARGPEAHAHLPLRGRKWQLENPREAYKIAMRALRCAKKVNTTTGAKQAAREEKAARSLKERLLAKHKGINLARTRATTRVWANRAEEEVEKIGRKIGDSLKNTLASNPELKEQNLKSVANARKHIDVSVQGPAASKGLKKFWEELRKDPIRYAEYINARKETLKKTLEAKAMQRRGEC